MPLVQARWVAGFHAVHFDGTELVPGVTTVKLDEAEAKASDHWEPVKADKQARKDAD